MIAGLYTFIASPKLCNKATHLTSIVPDVQKNCSYKLFYYYTNLNLHLRGIPILYIIYLFCLEILPVLAHLQALFWQAIFLSLYNQMYDETTRHILDVQFPHVVVTQWPVVAWMDALSPLLQKTTGIPLFS